jgi:hypothetical protein
MAKESSKPVSSNRLTLEQQYQNRLENAFCDILGAMDDPLSYTFEDNRYDVWHWDGKAFGRRYVAMTYDECKRMLDDLQGPDELAFIVPHVRIEQAEWFFDCIAKAGWKSGVLVTKAKMVADLKQPETKGRQKQATGSGLPGGIA